MFGPYTLTPLKPVWYPKASGRYQYNLGDIVDVRWTYGILVYDSGAVEHNINNFNPPIHLFKDKEMLLLVHMRPGIIFYESRQRMLRGIMTSLITSQGREISYDVTILLSHQDKSVSSFVRHPEDNTFFVREKTSLEDALIPMIRETGIKV